MTLNRLAILLEFGFHEVKKFVHSGLAEKLTAEFELFFMVLEKDRKVIEEQFGPLGNIIFISDNPLSGELTNQELLARASCEAWMRNQGIPLYHNYKSLPRKKKWDWLIGLPLIKSTLTYFALKKVKRSYFNNNIKKLLIENKITHVLGVSCTSTFAKSIFTSAQKIGLKTYYLVNSWKDLYVNPFVPIVDFTKIFVWSEQMKSDYELVCPYLDSDIIYISGNPTLDTYVEYKPHYKKIYYSRKYQINKNKPWLYYTMMPPGMWNDEIHHILEMARILEENDCEVEILIRRNPNHQKTDFTNLNLPVNCTLTDHYITYDKEKDLIIQTTEGEQEWMDLVFHSDANISIPSTVTLEFLALGKPVFNPSFSAVGDFPKDLYQHFESGFYVPVFLYSQLVSRISSFRELIKKLRTISTLKNVCLNIIKSSDLIIKEMDQ